MNLLLSYWFTSPLYPTPPHIATWCILRVAPFHVLVVEYVFFFDEDFFFAGAAISVCDPTSAIITM